MDEERKAAEIDLLKKIEFAIERNENFLKFLESKIEELDGQEMDAGFLGARKISIEENLIQLKDILEDFKKICSYPAGTLPPKEKKSANDSRTVPDGEW